MNCRHLYISSFDCLLSKGLAHAGRPEGRPGMSDVTLLSGISGLSFDSLFCLLSCFFLPSPLSLSVLSFFC